MPRCSYLKGVKIHRSADSKVFGNISGIPVGTRWDKRTGVSQDSVHAPLRAGIHGSSQYGAYSIVMSGGYEDDVDHGESFDYTGQGGRNLEGDKLDKMMGKNPWEAPQSADQEWKLGNLALKISVATGKPVRVVRGSNIKNSKYCPAEGYRYDGLYTVVDAWEEEGKAGFLMCKFRFERVKGQPPVPLCGDPVIGTSRVRKRKSSPEVESRPRKRGLQTSDSPVKKTKSGKRTAVMEGITFKFEGSLPA